MPIQRRAQRKRKAAVVRTVPDANKEQSHPRQVRAVHGQGQHGKKEIWLYAPEHLADRSGVTRKGWWLHPQTGVPGIYYIGQLENIQASMRVVVKDEAVFDNFPFTRSVRVDGAGKEIAKTIRCVTDRR